MGPYTIVEVDENKWLNTLENENGIRLKQKVNGCNLKIYFDIREQYPDLDLGNSPPENYKSRQGRRKSTSCFDDQQEYLAYNFYLDIF